MVLERAWKKLKEGGKDRDLRLFLFSHTREGRAGERGCSALLNAPGDERIRRCENKKKDILCISSPVRQLALGWRFPKLCLSRSGLPLSLKAMWKLLPLRLFSARHHENLQHIRYFLSRHFHLQSGWWILLSVFRARRGSCWSKITIHRTDNEISMLQNHMQDKPDRHMMYASQT